MYKVLIIIISKIRNSIRYNKTINSAKYSRVKINFGEKITFNQNTIITGKGLVSIGDCCSFGYVMGGYYKNGTCELQPRYGDSKIIIGKNVAMNNNLFICCASEVRIGDDTLIGENVMILDHDAHGLNPDDRRTSIGKVSPIFIGENAWIGSRAIVLPGTIIGNNSIVGAGTIVKGEFPANVIIAGNPASIVKKL